MIILARRDFGALPAAQLPLHKVFPKPWAYGLKIDYKFPIAHLLFGAVVVQTMIILILLYLSFFAGPPNALALPTDLRPPEILSRNHLQSIFIRKENRFDTRSIFNILWSCLTTIFACSWIAVHPNIPAPGDSQWTVLKRRLAIMGYVLLTPEMVIFWAWRQHNAASNFTKKHQENKGWTRVHAFFLIMGGFTLHKGGKPVRVLEAKELEELSEAGKIEWPTITEEEIADRSKGDYLSKTIVVFQTTWFILQCIARGAYGLAVTELEVVTLAFATLNGILYYFWWDKPLDVRCSIPVHLLEDDVEKQDTPPPEISDEEILKGDKKVVDLLNPLPSAPVQVTMSTPDSTLTSTGSHVVPPQEVSDKGMPQGDEKVVVTPDPLPSTSIQVDTSNPDPAPIRLPRFVAILLLPLARFFVSFADLAGCNTLGDKILRVPTFYAPPNNSDGTDIASIFAVCVSIIFGAIHCIAWSFHFPTMQEQWVWRISAILVLGLPIPYMALGRLSDAMKLDAKENKMSWMGWTVVWAVFGVVFLYTIARMVLLILPLIALRALPSGAYVELNWVSFIPHI
jgi:hypothetical protein